jgi:hypothetical protein
MTILWSFEEKHPKPLALMGRSAGLACPMEKPRRDECCRSSNRSPSNRCPPFVIPSEAEGSAVPRTSPGTRNSMLKQNCHLDRSVAQWRDLRVSVSFHADFLALEVRFPFHFKAVPFLPDIPVDNLLSRFPGLTIG